MEHQHYNIATQHKPKTKQTKQHTNTLPPRTPTLIIFCMVTLKFPWGLVFLPSGDLTYGTLQGHTVDVQEVGAAHGMCGGLLIGHVWGAPLLKQKFVFPPRKCTNGIFLGISKWVHHVTTRTTAHRTPWCFMRVHSVVAQPRLWYLL